MTIAGFNGRRTIDAFQRTDRPSPSTTQNKQTMILLVLLAALVTAAASQELTPISSTQETLSAPLRAVGQLSNGCTGYLIGPCHVRNASTTSVWCTLRALERALFDSADALLLSLLSCSLVSLPASTPGDDGGSLCLRALEKDLVGRFDLPRWQKPACSRCRAVAAGVSSQNGRPAAPKLDVHISITSLRRSHNNHKHTHRAQGWLVPAHATASLHQQHHPGTAVGTGAAGSGATTQLAYCGLPRQQTEWQLVAPVLQCSGLGISRQPAVA